VRENRRFLRRAVEFLAGEAGIDQFLDIGTGLPTADNAHEVAQRIAPRARIVYVDNDPIVLAHARALLTSSPEGLPPISTLTCANPRGSVRNVHVRGHIGVGEEAVDLPLNPAAGLTIVTARNGTGKTSIADGARHTLSGGTKRSYQVLAENVHYPHRDIVVTVGNGRRDFEIVCGMDEVVRWRNADGSSTMPPAEWTEAFERYMPVLLYPEMSQVIQDPSNLHAFLKDALELTALEELQVMLKADRRRVRRPGVQSMLLTPSR
jgi:hypothetical protein